MDGSAFRASLAKNSLPGTKPWINGVRLVSSGLAQLDQYLGGGLPLGSLILIEEDQNAVHATTLAQYFVSQGIASGHRVRIVGGDGLQGFQQFTNTLPANVSTRPQQDSSESDKRLTNESNPPVHLTDDDKDDGAKEQGEPQSSDLKIAWQYRKYLSNDGSGNQLNAMPQVGGQVQSKKKDKTKYCCAFDLHRRLSKDDWERSDTETLNVSKVMLQDRGQNSTSANGSTYSAAYSFLKSQISRDASNSAPTVKRVCVLGAGSPAWGGLSGGVDTDGEKQFLQLLHCIKEIVSSSPSGYPDSVAYVTVPSTMLPKRTLAGMRRIADGVIQVTAFAERGLEGTVATSTTSELLLKSQKQTSSAEFADYTGMISLKKVPCINSLVSARPDTLTYLFKRDRRKMKIEKFHLPPESTGAGATSTNPEDMKKQYKENSSQQNALESDQPAPSNFEFRFQSSGSTSPRGPQPPNSANGLVGLRGMDPPGEGYFADRMRASSAREPALEPGMACAASLKPDQQKNLYDF
eukprot:gb/GECG01003273.1/.p1 GENE.gb/GECG01003273.1/~~gb/GECG01003273.1/.p1  ORF type:complete len:521 (+),score=73.46 gb/GECG01003273.1/:1-1563(+)